MLGPGKGSTNVNRTNGKKESASLNEWMVSWARRKQQEALPVSVCLASKAGVLPAAPKRDKARNSGGEATTVRSRCSPRPPEGIGEEGEGRAVSFHSSTLGSPE